MEIARAAAGLFVRQRPARHPRRGHRPGRRHRPAHLLPLLRHQGGGRGPAVRGRRPALGARRSAPPRPDAERAPGPGTRGPPHPHPGRRRLGVLLGVGPHAAPPGRGQPGPAQGVGGGLPGVGDGTGGGAGGAARRPASTTLPRASATPPRPQSGRPPRPAPHVPPPEHCAPCPPPPSPAPLVAGRDLEAWAVETGRTPPGRRARRTPWRSSTSGGTGDFAGGDPARDPPRGGSGATPGLTPASTRCPHAPPCSAAPPTPVPPRPVRSGCRTMNSQPRHRQPDRQPLAPGRRRSPAGRQRAAVQRLGRAEPLGQPGRDEVGRGGEA